MKKTAPYSNQEKDFFFNTKKCKKDTDFRHFLPCFLKFLFFVMGQFFIWSKIRFIDLFFQETNTKHKCCKILFGNVLKHAGVNVAFRNYVLLTALPVSSYLKATLKKKFINDIDV